MDPAVHATVLLLSAPQGLKHVETAKCGLSLAQAIRFVMESLPVADRPHALIQTPRRSLYIAEIEAIYERPEFARLDDRFPLTDTGVLLE